jgi:hypothetical protein
MSFLQPAMLWGLPVIALPIIIHLINQRRYQTIPWGAMMFLLAANRMSRGYARLRRWLILLARTLAVTGLILAVSRPLASGWRGLLGAGQVDTTLILLDRSPSMTQSGAAGGASKLEVGLGQLVRSLGVLGSNHWVLIDSAQSRPLELDSIQLLPTLPQARAASASADLPAMLQTAFDYIQANRPSRTDVWLLSDLRQHDWDPESGRWSVLRDAFLASPHPVRFHLLAYPEAAAGNRSLRVTEVRRVESAGGAQLLLSLRIEQSPGSEGTVRVPVQIEIDGARSEMMVELSGTDVEIKDQAVPLDAGQVRGWGRASLPADANLADNEFYFVYDRPPPRKTFLVTEDADATSPLELAAGISPDPAVSCEVAVRAPHELFGVDWEGTALLVWQAPLPGPDLRGEVERFARRGGRVIFFPPAAPTDDEFAGVRWESWEELTSETPVAAWIGDQDLLAKTRSGAALPVGSLRVLRHCRLSGEATSLASLTGGSPLLARALTDQQNVYFCTSTVAPGDSSLARDGVVLYVMIQRALAAGAASLGTAHQLTAGEVASDQAGAWRPVAVGRDVPSDAYPLQAGIYEHEGKLLAVNRSAAEDQAAVVPDARVAALFDRLEFDRVDDRIGSGASLLEEIWRVFLALMMAALLVEAMLCLPKLSASHPPPGGLFPNAAAPSLSGRGASPAGVSP